MQENKTEHAHQFILQYLYLCAIMFSFVVSLLLSKYVERLVFPNFICKMLKKTTRTVTKHTFQNGKACIIKKYFY